MDSFRWQVINRPSIIWLKLIKEHRNLLLKNILPHDLESSNRSKIPLAYDREEGAGLFGSNVTLRHLPELRKVLHCVWLVCFSRREVRAAAAEAEEGSEAQW